MKKNPEYMEQWKDRRWRRLWFAGAFNREKVLRRAYAEELRAAQEECPDYFDIDHPDAIEKGETVKQWSVSGMDMLATASQNLRLKPRQYEKCFKSIFGITLGEWREKFYAPFKDPVNT